MLNNKATIGITYRSTAASVFYSGLNQTAITLYEVLMALGYMVTLMDTTTGEQTGFADYPPLPSKKLHETVGLDILVDIDGLVSAYQRKKAAKKTVVFMRTFLQFAEMDATAYIETPTVLRTMEGVDEIWCWDLLNAAETVPSIQTMFPCPIKRVPFVWSSSIADHFSKGRIAMNQQVQPSQQVNSWHVHVAEKNTNNMSSCVLPLVAIKELVQGNHFPNAIYHIHNTDTVKENRFFKENILHNIEPHTLPLVLEGKQAFWEWLSGEHLLFSHSRFTSLRIGLLNALWMGIPLIHNSTVLCDLHPILKEMYYTGNSIKEVSVAFASFRVSEWHSAVGAIREAMMNTFGIRAKLDQWTTVLQTHQVAQVLQTTQIQQPQQVTARVSLLVAFTDMWPGFNTDQNFFTDALRHEYPQMCVIGVWYDPAHNDKVDLLIRGPFFNDVKEANSLCDRGVPTVFFSAENWPIPQDLKAALYLTSSPIEDDTHLRVPTWATFIDWFSNSTVLPEPSEDNPIRLPLHFAMTPHPVPFEARPNFCGFVVSNPICAFRNDVFHRINQYKQVTSGGGLFNNIGGQLALKYPGGGGGDLSKHAFFSEHRFSISFENSKAPGYVTEKVLHAKMAGCVPLYWGDSHTTDFVPNSFINVSTVEDPNTVVEIMKRLEANPTMCAKMAATPILDEPRKQAVLQRMKRMCEKIMQLVQVNDVNEVVKKEDVKNEVLNEVNPFIPHTCIINLDTRPDRWSALLAAEPQLNQVTQVIERIPGVNGRTLQLTPDIYQLFQKNTFKWKKSIIGCALSHLSVWKMIAQESEGTHESNKSNAWYLVLEDDVRFQPNWQTRLRSAFQHVPADADLLYIGGVLPPNKPALPSVLQSVNEYWATIQPNTLFTPMPLPIFHFCNYSYLLTPAGAQKIVRFVTEHGLSSPCDHLFGHPALGLRIYVSQPLLTYCFQEEDPTYVHATFNELHKANEFDSDICNNVECFTEVEIQSQSSSPPESSLKRIIYHMAESKPCDVYERVWLEDMMQVKWDLQPLLPETMIEPHSWFLVQRPYLEPYNHLFTELTKRDIPFHVLHLSDEFAKDDISFYALPMCQSVLRNYLREDFPERKNVTVLPLGYHHKPTANHKTWEERELMWSFHGTDWFDRSKQLQPLSIFVPHSCHLQPDWNHSTATKPHQYLNLLNNSKFCPILKGNNDETFRLYEALEAGCLPVTTITNKTYLQWVDRHLGLNSLYEWTNPIRTIQCNTMTESLRLEVGKRWAQWKQQIQQIQQSIQPSL